MQGPSRLRMDRLLELTAQAEQSHFWFRGFRWFVRPEIARAVAGLARPRLLDCGCGTGANVRLLTEYGHAYGFDVTWRGLQFARAAKEAVVRASLDAAPFPDASFDVVTSFDVLQCVPDHIEQAGVVEFARLLRPGGHLIVNVAALEILSGGHSALSHEYRRYTPSQLRLLIEGAGFRIERLTFVHAMLFPLILGVRLMQRITSGNHVEPGEYEIATPPAPVNALLTGLVRAEASALRLVDMPFGSSLLCHAIKA
jgi:SAM-dependent methyltransferase